MMIFEAITFPRVAFFFAYIFSSGGGGRSPAGFHELFEAAQVFSDSPLRVFAEEFCEE